MTESSESTESKELLQFKSIISDKTHYGVIWEGIHENKVCVVKVVILNTGVHYNKREGEVRTTIINEVNKKTLYPTLEKNISKEAIFLTDGLGAYTDILKLAERLNNMNQYQMIMVKTCVVIGIQIQLKASLAN